MNLERFSGRQKDLLAVACLGLLIFMIYGNTYHVSWYFDDIDNITHNANVYTLANPLQTLFSPRGPATLSFALNYAIHGNSLPGYHLINNLIHFMTAVVVYLVLKRVAEDNRILALCGALAFAAHPLQTQAVTYIVQRMTSLAALFAFLSLYCCIRGREKLADGMHFISLCHVRWYLAMLVFCVLAIMTKQNTAFLPLGLYVFGRYFLDSAQGWNRKRGLFYLAPLAVLPFLVAYPILFDPLLRGVSVSEIATTGKSISPLRYFVSEWQVQLAYLRLLFVPIGQALDYAYPLVSEMFSFTTVLCGSLLGLLMYGAYRLRASARQVSFAIVWFFLALAVESTFIPLDLFFEHRLYIPMFGFSVTFIWLLRLISQERYRNIFAALVIVTFSLLTVQRNYLWSDPVAFYEDNLRRAPHNERLYVELSSRYVEKKRYDEAEIVLEKGLTVNSQSGMLLNNLGTLYTLRGEQGRAIDVFKRAIAVDPDYAKSYLNLAVVYESRSEYEPAMGLLRKAVSINPAYAAAHFNLGVIYYKRGDRGRALESFRSALALAPSDTDAMYNVVMTALETGDRDAARSVLARLESLDAVRAAEIKQKF